jgi:prepilin-type N-terminal cleavage/methylation domain-containing protein
MTGQETKTWTGRRASGAEEGFTLVELLVALALGLMMAAVMIQGLLGASRSGERWGLQLRERQLSRRTLALLRSELAMARNWVHGPASGAEAECGLGTRTPVLRLEANGRWISYSIGQPPSRIWRGWVLMRCGPAYGLSGELSEGAAQNRVVIDGLVPDGFQVEADVLNVVRLDLRRSLPLPGGMSLIIRESILATEPET